MNADIITLQETILTRGVDQAAEMLRETFYVLSGQIEALILTAKGSRWIPLDAGQIFFVPPNARHALRNRTAEPGVSLIVSTPSMARFFEQMGIPLDSPDERRRPPTPNEVDRMMALTAERGDWNAGPEENAAVGIDLPPQS